MPKLTISDLTKIKEQHKSAFTVREGGARAKVIVHMGTCGIAAGARKIVETLLDEINLNNSHDVIVTTSGCAGLCSQEPMATIEIAGFSPVKYVKLDEMKTREIFKKHILNGEIIEKYALVSGNETQI
ncbi:MAG TPA: (2Fe-2S) ferredoxin domain-containing protein [Nitrospirae bacterium]|nr:(2Fe-2S) ferredoxin domain-containing protein [Nitrospirota bacterium]